MHRTARFFGGVLLLTAILAVPYLVFQNYQKSRQSRMQLEHRMAELESKLAQEVAVRQALLAGGQAQGFVRPDPTTSLISAHAVKPEDPSSGKAFPEMERIWRQEMEKKDQQIAHLRSMVEKLVSGVSPESSPGLGGSPQMAIEALATNPAPAVSSAGLMMNLLVGEITQIEPQNRTIFINRGSRHGVKPGMSFEVYRKGRLIGRLRAEAIYDAVCSAIVVETQMPLQAGDMIRSA